MKKEFTLVLEDDKPQLIDLNEDESKFEINFKVNAQNQTEFKALVLPKTELDKYSSLKDIQMKTAPGFIKGTVTASDDKLENYFIVVKRINTSEPLQLDFQIDINQIDINQIDDIQTDSSNSSSTLTDHKNLNQSDENNYNFGTFLNDYFYIILFILIISIIYYYYKNGKKKKTDVCPSPPNPSSSTLQQPTSTNHMKTTDIPLPQNLNNVPLPQNVKQYLDKL